MEFEMPTRKQVNRKEYNAFLKNIPHDQRKTNFYVYEYDDFNEEEIFITETIDDEEPLAVIINLRHRKSKNEMWKVKTEYWIYEDILTDL